MAERTALPRCEFVFETGNRCQKDAGHDDGHLWNVTKDRGVAAVSPSPDAQTEHDRDFAPQHEGESDYKFLLRCLSEHRKSHADWVEWYAADPSREGELKDGHTAGYQQAAVVRYDHMIDALEGMYPFLGRDVQPPRLPGFDAALKRFAAAPAVPPEPTSIEDWEERDTAKVLDTMAKEGWCSPPEPTPPHELRLHGRGTDHIWLMQDGQEPHTIGIRLDCGDSGVVYVTPEQAADLAEQLTEFTKPETPPEPTPVGEYYVSAIEALARAMWIFEGDNHPTWEECIRTDASVVYQYRNLAEFVIKRVGRAPAEVLEALKRDVLAILNGASFEEWSRGALQARIGRRFDAAVKEPTK